MKNFNTIFIFKASTCLRLRHAMQLLSKFLFQIGLATHEELLLYSLKCKYSTSVNKEKLSHTVIHLKIYCLHLVEQASYEIFNLCNAFIDTCCIRDNLIRLEN